MIIIIIYFIEIINTNFYNFFLISLYSWDIKVFVWPTAYPSYNHYHYYYYNNDNNDNNYNNNYSNYNYNDYNNNLFIFYYNN